MLSAVPKLCRLASLLRTRVLLSRAWPADWTVVRTTQTECPIETEFHASRAKLARLTEPPQDIRVQLFALFQQATLGKCHMTQSERMPECGSHEEWEAWIQLQAMPKKEAQKRYIDLVNTIAGTDSGIMRFFSTANRLPSLQTPALEDWSDDLKVTKQGHVIYVCLNRPAKKNALSLQMYDEITLTLENAAQDPEVYLVVFTGKGEYFCNGNDLTTLTNINPEDIETQTRQIKSIIKNFVLSFIDFPKPLVALVNGPAVGIAVSLLGLFDAVYAVETATFDTPFMQNGQCPVGCASYTFPIIMGSAKAGEMLIFNRKLTTQGAVERNLVSQAFPEDVFQKETQALIDGFAALPPQGLQVAKMLLRKREKEKLRRVNEEECEALLDRWKSKESWDAVLDKVQRSSMGESLDDV